jgi:hypothetical protein
MPERTIKEKSDGLSEKKIVLTDPGGLTKKPAIPLSI